MSSSGGLYRVPIRQHDENNQKQAKKYSFRDIVDELTGFFVVPARDNGGSAVRERVIAGARRSCGG